MTREDAVILFVVSSIVASLAVLLVAMSGCKGSESQQNQKRIERLTLKTPSDVSRRYWRRQQFRKAQREQ